MCLRETRRTNRDGSVVAYLQLAHNERHPETESSVVKAIHNFSRAETVDPDALAQLVWSISRFLSPEQATAAAAGAEVNIMDPRPWVGRGRRDEFIGSLRGKPGLRRYLRRTGGGLLRVDVAAIGRETHLDGKRLLRTSDGALTPEDLAAAESGIRCRRGRTSSNDQNLWMGLGGVT